MMQGIINVIYNALYHLLNEYILCGCCLDLSRMFFSWKYIFQKCTELNWVCIPMAVEVYGAWGEEA